MKHASVTIDGKVHGQIGEGFLILLGITHEDTEAQAVKLADKLTGLRIFEDENGKMNRGLDEVKGELLVVSQFTLYGNCKKGRRPEFLAAARPEVAIPPVSYTHLAAVSAYLFTLLYLAIGLVISGIDWLISGGPQAEVLSYAETYMPEFTIYLQPAEPILHLPALVAGFVSIVLSLVSAVLSAGYILYTMRVRRGIVTPYSCLLYTS